MAQKAQGYLQDVEEIYFNILKYPNHQVHNVYELETFPHVILKDDVAIGD